MAQDSGQERTHQPSERKLRKAAEKGQIVRSRELTGAAVLAAGAGTLAFAHGPAARALAGLSRSCFDAAANLDIDDLGAALDLLRRALRAASVALAAPLGALVAGVLLVGFAQTRFQLATRALELDWRRVDPFAGFRQRYLSPTPLVELGKGLAKILALGWVTWGAIRDTLPALPAMAAMTPSQQGAALVDLGWTIVAHAMPLVLAVAAADYAWNWWKLHDDLKMTLQEVKDERKEAEGDPNVRATRRARARQVAQANAIRHVRRADVVVTNPTHFAVALRYRREESPAPIVVAKGVDHLALEIRREARLHDVPQVENRLLARSLYARGRIGRPIPEALYGPVAQVLAVIYRRRQRRHGARG